MKSWTGPVITGLIVVGVGAILFTNMQTPGGPGRTRTAPKAEAKADAPTAPATGAQETPIGDPVIQNHIQVAAVYLTAVSMDGTDPGGAGLIHLEADIKSAEGNPNGLGKDEFVPYLKVAYEIVPTGGGPAIDKGELNPMVAWDGLHYGANIAMPKPGEYKLVYEIKPPSAGGLGRHSDRATGVAPWWEPFRTTFEWTVEAKPPATAGAG